MSDKMREAFERKNYIDPSFCYHKKLNLYVFNEEDAPKLNGGLVRLNEDWGAWQIAWKSCASHQVEQEPVGWQFYSDGKWHNGMESADHYQNTVDAGFLVRQVYTHPQPATIPEGWKLIESAPTNRKILICQGRNGIVAAARWDAQHNIWSTGMGTVGYIAEVTHWMELPAAPKVEG